MTHTTGANANGVDTGVHVTLVYSGGRIFTFATSILGDLSNGAVVSGTEKTVKVGSISPSAQ